MKKDLFQSIVLKVVPPENIDKTDTGYNFIPIYRLENMLDPFNWNTRNFQYQIYKDGYANLCVAASLELEISYTETNGSLKNRNFVGACNFSLSSIEPNSHFLATAKSECIKNAATDIGLYFGRGINESITPSGKKIERKAVKKEPDSKIMQQFMDAVLNKDEATITLLTNIYEIKTNQP